MLFRSTVKYTITALYGLAPAISSTLALVVLLLFPINEGKHQAIQLAIEKLKQGYRVMDPLTGKEVIPHSQRNVDEPTSWFLDHFSVKELQRTLTRGQSTLTTSTTFAILCSLMVSALAFAGVIIALGALSSPPGLVAVLCIVLTGISVTALCYHLLRLKAAWGLMANPLPEQAVRGHLQDLSV